MFKEYFLWLCKFVTKLVVLLIFIPALILAIIAVATNNVVPAAKNAQGVERVGVVELTGVIEDAKEILAQLNEFAVDDSVKAIVLRIDSPGGAVGPSQEINETVSELKLKKPIVASMGSIAASGGLYSAVNASKVFALPGTLTGSIGVIMEFPNLTEVSDKVGVHMITLKSGALKDVGNPFRTIEPHERAYLQEKLDLTHEQFIAAVAHGRGISVESVRAFADGRILLGSEAKELQLIDELGGVEKAAKSALVLAGINDKSPELVYKKDPLRDLKHFVETKLLFGFSASVLTPKFQYLATF